MRLLAKTEMAFAHDVFKRAQVAQFDSRLAVVIGGTRAGMFAPVMVFNFDTDVFPELKFWRRGQWNVRKLRGFLNQMAGQINVMDIPVSIQKYVKDYRLNAQDVVIIRQWAGLKIKFGSVVVRAEV